MGKGYEIVQAENPDKWILRREGDDLLIFDSKTAAEEKLKELSATVGKSRRELRRTGSGKRSAGAKKAKA